MNNDDLITAMRESVTGVHTTTGLEQIVRRGRAIRARRRIPGLAGTPAVAAGAILAVAALTPAGHQADHQATAQLAAWTVTKLADGNVSVTIRELKDPAGLQSTLRADGVPASVTFQSQRNPACRAYPGGKPEPQLVTALLTRVFPVPYQSRPFPPRGLAHRRIQRYGPFRPPRRSPNFALIVIHPSALPGNVGVQIAVSSPGPHGPSGVWAPGLVYASAQCTGS